MTQVSALSQRIWEAKYRFKSETGEPVEIVDIDAGSHWIADPMRSLSRSIAAENRRSVLTP